MDPKRVRRTIITPFGGMALAVALLLAIPAAASAAGSATAWTRQFGTNKNDCVKAIAVDGRGRIVVAGITTGMFPGQVSKGAVDAFLRAYRH